MSALGLTPYERHKLRQQIHRTRDARLLRRLLAILEVDQGKPVPEVARQLQVSGQSVYNWVDRFCQQRQTATLADQQRSGRPTLWTEERSALLRCLLGSSPEDWDYLANDWTVPMLQEELRHTTRQEFAEDTIRRELHRLGYVWKRGRYQLAADPELEKKTADSQASAEFAASERTAGRRRDRPAAVSAPAGRLVAAGAAEGSLH
jgi:transposase